MPPMTFRAWCEMDPAHLYTVFEKGSVPHAIIRSRGWTSACMHADGWKKYLLDIEQQNAARAKMVAKRRAFPPIDSDSDSDSDSDNDSKPPSADTKPSSAKSNDESDDGNSEGSISDVGDPDHSSDDSSVDN